MDTPAYDWDRMEPGHKVAGPALIDDKTTTVLVLPGFSCEVDDYRNLVLRPVADTSAKKRIGCRKRSRAANEPERDDDGNNGRPAVDLP